MNSFDQEPEMLSGKIKFPYVVLEDNKKCHKGKNRKRKPGGKENTEVFGITWYSNVRTFST